MEWTIPAFAYPAKGGTHLQTQEGWKAELLNTHNSIYQKNFHTGCQTQATHTGIVTVQTKALDSCHDIYNSQISPNKSFSDRLTHHAGHVHTGKYVN